MRRCADLMSSGMGEGPLFMGGSIRGCPGGVGPMPDGGERSSRWYLPLSLKAPGSAGARDPEAAGIWYAECDDEAPDREETPLALEEDPSRSGTGTRGAKSVSWGGKPPRPEES